MTKNYEHSISGHIRRMYRKKLISPMIYLVILASLWLLLPLSDILFPQRLERMRPLDAYSQSGSSYIHANLKDLYFTGYTNTLWGRTNGYYYYVLQEKQCIVVLLSPKTCEEGLPYIDSVSIRGRVLLGNTAYAALLDCLAGDLDWTREGISQKVNAYFISEPAYKLGLTVFLLAVYFLTGAYALVRLLLDIVYICIPIFCPACRRLGLFGKPSELLAQAETELATLPQLATEDMFITEHYFIILASCEVAVVPIAEIIWIYKYSTLHKILWYHFSISYTLHITANKHLYIQCPENMKSDIDGIIDYLAEANHDILVGFNEENRIKVCNMQHYRPNMQKLLCFLHHKH
ncbi:hypothetical protein D3Z36_09250 [Lachnospiraceae bacterium]|nr:hypothetical protein [Lachnospiraceae bacterium]